MYSQQNPYDAKLNETKRRLEEINNQLEGRNIVYNNQRIVQVLGDEVRKMNGYLQKIQAIPNHNTSQHISILASELEKEVYNIQTISQQLRTLASNIQNLENEKRRLESEIPNLERQSKMWLEEQARKQKDQMSGGGF